MGEKLKKRTLPTAAERNEYEKTIRLGNIYTVRCRTTHKIGTPCGQTFASAKSKEKIFREQRLYSTCRLTESMNPDESFG